MMKREAVEVTIGSATASSLVLIQDNSHACLIDTSTYSGSGLPMASESDLAAA
jgi:hypothetical protein